LRFLKIFFLLKKHANKKGERILYLKIKTWCVFLLSSCNWREEKGNQKRGGGDVFSVENTS
jgi:hypothetical protein